jgi:hypothetical protein
MTRRLGMNQLIGEFFRHPRHQITMFAEKRNMLMIRSRFHRIDFNRVRAPVFEKRRERLARQCSGS